jgi:hypothetical protein
VSESSALRARAMARIADLKAEIAGLEAVNVGTNEPVIRQLKAQLAELVALLGPPNNWRDGMRARGIEAGAEYWRKRGRR